MAAMDLDQAIEQYHQNLREFVKGNPEPQKQMFSHRDDVSLSNPLGPTVRGWAQVAEVLERAPSQIREGEGMEFENVVKYVTPELAFIVEEERVRARIGGQKELAPIGLRVTTIFRPEDGTWKVVHRHADPITSARPVESIIRAA